MKIPAFVFGAFGLFSISFFACTNDKATDNRAALVGRWEVVQGARNGKPTQTLNGIFFDFGTNGKMSTNMPTFEGEGLDYEVTPKQLLQKGTQPLAYQLKELTDSSLTLSTEVRTMQFDLHLRRATAANPVPNGDSLIAPTETAAPQDSLQ